MAKASVFTGARAKVYVNNELVGLFDSCSYSVNIGSEPIHILGKYNAAEIVQTSYEAVTVNCSGFRIIGQGAHLLPAMPTLQELLGLKSITIHISDRQNLTDLPIMQVVNCIPVSYSDGVQSKSTSKIQISYIGTHLSDESGTQTEEGTASALLPSDE